MSFIDLKMLRSEEHTSELQSLRHLVCRLLLDCYVHHRALHSFPTRRSSDLEYHLAAAVDADHRRHVGHGGVVMAAHHGGDCSGLDAVVHRDPALIRDRVLELDVLHRFEDVVGFVHHVELLMDCVKRRGFGYDARLAGTFRPSSAAMPLMRFFARASPSLNVTTLTRGCDQIGCRRLAASSARSACLASHLLKSAILCAAWVGSVPRI